MIRNKIIRDILSDEELLEKYAISEKDIANITTSPPYQKKIIEIIATIINENSNNLNDPQIYKRLKNIHKI
jgi:CHASE3 domain sensor protein